MKPKLLSVLIAGLFVPALAQGQVPPKEVSGSITLGVRHTGINANDPSKFREYRDIEPDTQLLGGFEFRSRGPRDYMNAYGENLGHDDQYLDVNGGRYGAYKYRVFADSLRHNFGAGQGALSPYTGIGGNTLVASLPNLNVRTWNGFDHSYKRTVGGGMFELQATSPWYFRVDANEVKRAGINVFAGAKGTSPGNGFMDLPAPIDYTTRNVSGEIGWSSKTAHVALNIMKSSFDNGNEVLRWSNNYMNPAGGLLDTTVLPPSNELTRIALNGNLRSLPMESTLAARFTHTTTTADVTMQQQMLDVTRSTPTVFNLMDATNPSSGTFNGKHVHETFAISLASRPTPALDTKLFWNYDKLKNESNEVTFNPGAGTTATSFGSGLRAGSTDPTTNCANVTGSLCEPEMFHYTKKTLGAEAGYRLSKENKLLGGLDYTKTERERADFVETEETRFFAEWKNSSLENATGRVKYTFTDRRSEFEPHQAVLNANPMDLFVRRFDFSNAHIHQLKFAGDANVGGGFDIGAEIILKKVDYLDVPLGRTGDDRQEYYVSLGWGDPSSLRLLAFGDIEYSTYESKHRVGTGNPDPTSGNSNSTYNWSAKNQDTSWQLGIGADWVPHTRLKVKSSLIYAQTNGEADFSSQQTGTPLANTRPIRNFDNTTRIAFTMKGAYEMTRRLELGAGYSYERYKYSDIGYNNTKYVATGTSNQEAYTTGQFAFQPYSVNLVFATAKYKF